MTLIDTYPLRAITNTKKLFASFCFIAAFFLLLACPSLAQYGDARDIIPSPPSFMRTLSVELGKDKVKRLERKIGKGFVTVGGHSNSGRSWSYANRLHLLLDGFYFDSKGDAILDELSFLDWEGRLGDTKELAKFGFGIWGRLRRGMTQKECLQLLPKSLPQPTVTTDEISWKQDIKGVFRRRHGKFQYEALLRFRMGRLDSLFLSSFFDETRK